MRGKWLAVNGISERDRAAWQDLATRAAEPNPLFEPACIVPAARHLEGGDDIRLVVAEEQGRFYGCLPVKGAASWHRLPVRALTTYEGNEVLLRLYPERRSISTYLVSLGGRREATLVRALPKIRALRTRTQVAWAHMSDLRS